jgi:NAD(P)-dependent dehydrogenase (short-subunit alcohol dehydrogenase family)
MFTLAIASGARAQAAPTSASPVDASQVDEGVVPGNVRTPRQMKWYTPEGEAEIVAAQCLKGRIEPSDVVALAMFLASDDARFITGHEYFVDAGWR